MKEIEMDESLDTSHDTTDGGELGLSQAMLQASDDYRNYTPVSKSERVRRWLQVHALDVVFVVLFITFHALMLAMGIVEYNKSEYSDARAEYGSAFSISRASAFVLQIDAALILIPLIHSILTWLKIIPRISLTDTIHAHVLIGYSMAIFTVIHVVSIWITYGYFANKFHLGASGWFIANFDRGPGLTGWFMLIMFIMIMVTSMLINPRSKTYTYFRMTHFLFIPFFVLWSVHGNFCQVRTDSGSCVSKGNFWIYAITGCVLYALERIIREFRVRRRTYISKVIQHPSRICEIQIRKVGFRSKVGQYILLACPEISLFSYYPYTLTSAPEEDYLSIHVKCDTEFSINLAQRLGCDFADEMKTVIVDPAETGYSLRRVLPTVLVDGPFGGGSQNIFKYDTLLLIGSDEGVIPFASILKSIWYHNNYATGVHHFQKVYFFHVCSDYDSLEWFRSLLYAIEQQDNAHMIEIHVYVTSDNEKEDAETVILNNGTSDEVMALRARTMYGRPEWDRVFRGLTLLHPSSEIGVFYNGPKELSNRLRQKCWFWDGSTRFRYNGNKF